MYTFIFLALICTADTSKPVKIRHFVCETDVGLSHMPAFDQYDLQLFDNGAFVLENLYFNSYFGKKHVSREHGVYCSHGDTLELISFDENNLPIKKYRWINDNASLKPLGNTFGFELDRKEYWPGDLPVIKQKTKIDVYYQGHL